MPLARVAADGSDGDSAVVRGRFVFRASTAKNGDEPWVSDGTARGTRLLADLVPGVEGSDPYDFVRFRRAVYFLAARSSGGTSLWRTDGSRSGTRLVNHWDAGATGLVSTQMELFLLAATPEHGLELWASDGSGAGTREVEDIWPGPTGGPDQESVLVPAGDVVLFKARQRADVSKPWASDGTEAGTRRLDSYPDDVDLHVGDIGVIGDQVVLAAGDDRSGQELWGGGTSTGVDGVIDLYPGDLWGGPQDFTSLDHSWVFTASTEDVGRELWVTDGTAGGTGLLRDIVPGQESGRPGLLTPVGRSVLFTALDGAGDSGLWRTSGTTATTRRVDLPENLAYAEPFGSVGHRAVVVAVTGSDRPKVLVSDHGTAPLLPVVDRRLGLRSGSDVEWIGSVGNVGIVSVVDSGAGQPVVAGWNAVPSRTRVPRRMECRAGEQVRVPVRVTSPEGAPGGGVVRLLVGDRAVGRARLVDGAASVRLTAQLAPGLHRLRARWTGSLQAAGSTSGPLLLRIGRAVARACR